MTSVDPRCRDALRLKMEQRAAVLRCSSCQSKFERT